MSLVIYRKPFLNVSEYNIIAIMTEWDEFKYYDWKKFIKKPLNPHTFLMDVIS